MNDPERLHTFQSDVARNIETNGVSKLTIAIAENKKRQGGEVIATVNNEGRDKRKIILGGSLFLLILIGGGYYLYSRSASSPSPLPIAQIPVDSKELLVFENEEEVEISNIRTTSVEITHFKLKQSTPQTLAILSPSIPSYLLRSFQQKGFIGAIDGQNFVVVKSDSYERAFSGMLEWEPSMKVDLLGLFNAPIATSAQSWFFTDKIMNQKNVRSLQNNKGEVAFVYGFYNLHTIVLAKNEQTMSALYNMLSEQNVI